MKLFQHHSNGTQRSKQDSRVDQQSTSFTEFKSRRSPIGVRASVFESLEFRVLQSAAPQITSVTATPLPTSSLGVASTDIGSESSAAVSDPKNPFSAFGVLPPTESAFYDATFNASGDALRVNASMTSSAEVLSVLDLVLPLKGLKSPADFVGVLDKIYRQTPLGDAAKDFEAAVDSGSASEAIHAAKAIADHIGEIATHPAVRAELQKFLKPLCLSLTKSVLKKASAIGTIIELSEKLIDGVDLGATELVIGSASVTFTAQSS